TGGTITAGHNFASGAWRRSRRACIGDRRASAWNRATHFAPRNRCPPSTAPPDRTRRACWIRGWTITPTPGCSDLQREDRGGACAGSTPGAPRGADVLLGARLGVPSPLAGEGQGGGGGRGVQNWMCCGFANCSTLAQSL